MVRRPWSGQRLRQLRIAPQTPGPPAGGLFNLIAQAQGVVAVSSDGPLLLLGCPQQPTSLTRRRRPAGQRTCSRRSRAASRWVPSLGAARASPSSWPSTARASWWSSPARASRWWRRPEREYLTDADFVTAPYRTARYQVACRVREDRCAPSSPGCRRRLTNTRAQLDCANRWVDAR